MTGRPVLLIVDGNKQAEALAEPIETFFDLLVAARDTARPLLLPALDVIPAQRLSPHAEIAEQRAKALWRLASERVPIIVAPAPAALLRTEPAEFYRQLALTLRFGDEIGLDDLVAHLESIGYERREPVEMVGEYSVRGGIVDVFSPEAAKPMRLEFFGDQIESIRQFDVDSQRSVLKLEECIVLPLIEHPKSHALFEELAAAAEKAGEEDAVPVPGEPFPGWELAVPLVRPRTNSIFGLLQRPIVIWDEPEQLRGAAERLWKRLEEPERAALCPPERVFFQWEEFEEKASKEARIRWRELDLAAAGSGSTVHIPCRPTMSFQGNMQVAVAEARTQVENGARVICFAASNGELERLSDVLQEYSIPYQFGLESSDAMPQYLAERAYLAGSVASTYLVKGLVRRGAIFPDSQLALFGSEDLFGASEWAAKRAPAKSTLGAFAADLADLKPGDYVVHAEHGIGRFLGLREISQGDQNGDYMLLEYAGDARLYVPLTRLDLIQKHRGAGEARPTLDRLGGATWNRTKTRVKAKMRDMADELLKLYAERKMAEGFTFSPDSNWQREFEDPLNLSKLRTNSTPCATSSAIWNSTAHGPAVVRRRWLRQDGSGHALRF